MNIWDIFKLVPSSSKMSTVKLNRLHSQWTLIILNYAYGEHCANQMQKDFWLRPKFQDFVQKKKAYNL